MEGRVFFAACFPNDARIRSASVEINVCVEKLPWILVLVREEEGRARIFGFFNRVLQDNFHFSWNHAIEQVGYMHAYC